MSEVRTYNPSRVLVLVGGIDMKGFSDGSFVEIAPMADLVTSKSGADAEVARSINTDDRHTVTIRLQQTSPSNDVLSAFVTADRLSGGAAVLPVVVKDLMGRTLFAVDQAWISKRPTQTYSMEVSEREWTLETGKPVIFIVGGNI